MILEPEALDEVAAAAAWYDDQRTGLGEDLVAALDDVLERIEREPESFPRDRFDERTRRAHLARFPYAAIFVVHQGEVRVIAFCHAKRRPGYWRGRV